MVYPLLRTTHKTSQTEQAKQAEPPPVAATPVCPGGCGPSILVALVTLATCLSHSRQSQRYCGKTQSQYSRSNVSFHCCFPPLQCFASRYSAIQSCNACTIVRSRKSRTISFL